MKYKLQGVKYKQIQNKTLEEVIKWHGQKIGNQF